MVAEVLVLYLFLCAVLIVHQFAEIGALYWNLQSVTLVAHTCPVNVLRKTKTTQAELKTFKKSDFSYTKKEYI